jgi:hypothetical protein
MILPNKIVRLEDSALSLVPLILELGPAPIPAASLFQEVADDFESLDQFLLALDLLFALGRIDVDMTTGVVSYVNRD